MIRRASKIAALILVITVSAVWAEVDEHQEVVWDFTQPKTIESLVRWTHPDHLNATSEGFGWTGEANASYDVVISSRQPTAVGWAWHPVGTVSVQAEVVPAGEFTFTENSVTFPHSAGTLYARYSPDHKHWSTWQAMELQVPRDKAKPRMFYQGTLRVPYSVRERYEALLKEFAGTDRPVTVDEEAAVASILKKQPDFFEKELPFIGYVDFLWETQVRGDQRVKRMTIGLGYMRSGHVTPPRGSDERNRWRFKAAGA